MLGRVDKKKQGEGEGTFASERTSQRYQNNERRERWGAGKEGTIKVKSEKIRQLRTK